MRAAGVLGPAAAKGSKMKMRKTKTKMKKTKKTAKHLPPRVDATAAAAAAAERVAAKQAAAEAARRARHLKALRRVPGAERELEELVFGHGLDVGEDELLQRLAGPQRLHDTERKSFQEGSSDSEVENEAKGKVFSKKPAWVDEDDEAEENVDMTHRYRKDFMKSDAEKVLTKKQLKRRLEEQFQRAMGGVPAWADLENRQKSKKTASDSK